MGMMYSPLPLPVNYSPGDVPVEAVHEPLAYGAEVSHIGHYCAVSGVSL